MSLSLTSTVVVAIPVHEIDYWGEYFDISLNIYINNGIAHCTQVSGEWLSLEFASHSSEPCN